MLEEEEAALVDIHLVRHFYPLLQLAGILARAGAAFAGNDSMFLPLSSLPTPATRASLTPSPPPFSIPHNERSRNAGGQCSRKADSGIAVWPGTVHRSPSLLHLLHPREREPHSTSSSSTPNVSPSLALFSSSYSTAALLLPAHRPQPSLLAPCASGRALPVGCASIRDLTLLRRRFARCGTARRDTARRVAEVNVGGDATRRGATRRLRDPRRVAADWNARTRRFIGCRGLYLARAADFIEDRSLSV